MTKGNFVFVTEPERIELALQEMARADDVTETAARLPKVRRKGGGRPRRWHLPAVRVPTAPGSTCALCHHGAGAEHGPMTRADVLGGWRWTHPKCWYRFIAPLAEAPEATWTA